jgi:proline iminopeptidase
MNFLSPRVNSRPEQVRADAAWTRPRHLAVAGHRRMAWRAVGEVGSQTWLVLHGGPGSGGQAGLIAPFSSAGQTMVVPDQRGSGAGRPRGDLHGNHTAALVVDLETLRRAVGIERWSVLAGSWGTVLALAYAERYPERVERLVLRGAFAVSRRELRGVLVPGQQVRRRAGVEPLWPARDDDRGGLVMRRLQQVLQSGTPGVTARRLLRHWSRVEQVLALRGMERSLLHAVGAGQTGLARQVRRQISSLRRGLRRDRAQASTQVFTRKDRGLWQKFRIQAHYLRRRCFIRPGQLDGAVRQVAQAGVPMDWVHGRFDAVCPTANSLRWHRLAQAVAPGCSRLHQPICGHLGVEPTMLATLRALVDPCR